MAEGHRHFVRGRALRFSRTSEGKVDPLSQISHRLVDIVEEPCREYIYIAAQLRNSDSRSVNSIYVQVLVEVSSHFKEVVKGGHGMFDFGICEFHDFSLV